MNCTLIFHCQIITPMFLHGADGKTPELRAQSIKGGLRFWWRALHGDLKLKDLKEEEAQIFGTSDQEVGRSPFSIQVDRPAIPHSAIISTSPVPHWEDKPGKTPFKANAIQPGHRFRVTIRLAQNVPIKHSRLNAQYLENLFVLFSMLGGLGKRARRGFGSFKIISIKRGDNQPEKQPVINEPLNLVKTLYQSISQHTLQLREGRLYTSLPQYANGFPYVERIAIGQTIHQNLVKAIGQQTHDFSKRATHLWDYKNAMGHTDARLASPVYISALDTINGLVPVITTLHTALKNHQKLSKVGHDIQKDFQNKLL